ncbi:MAG: ATP-binding cassette domain-containing protein [Clostridia bacterium]|nr:ATP-binding cassette domain-containing protein [Clostridia bacterium]
MDCILRTVGVSKRYRGRFVLKDVSMTVNRGDIYGFVGENGSGKTTVIRLVTGLIAADEGHVELFGHLATSPEAAAVRGRIGAIVEAPSIYRNLSARENLLMQSAILGIKSEERIREVLGEVGLSELYDDKKKAGNFSLGMRQRLGIAMALLGEPELLLLDEPMNGLDPAGIVEVRELILRLNRERGITFLISSHILSELSLVATKYGIISRGKLLREITAEELEHECRPTITLEVNDPEALLALLPAVLPEAEWHPVAGGVRLVGEVDLTALLRAVLDAGLTVLSVNCCRSGIEDYYLSLVGGGHHA